MFFFFIFAEVFLVLEHAIFSFHWMQKATRFSCQFIQQLWKLFLPFFSFLRWYTRQFTVTNIRLNFLWYRCWILVLSVSFLIALSSRGVSLASNKDDVVVDLPSIFSNRRPYLLIFFVTHLHIRKFGLRTRKDSHIGFRKTSSFYLLISKHSMKCAYNKQIH